MNSASHLNVVPPYEDDAFISYRHLDNTERDENDKGWIDNFHDRLTNRLGFLLGEEPKIWRDPRLPGNVYIADFLQGKIKQTIILISIISNGYLRSDWCMGELREFCRLAEENGGLQLDGKLRIFRVARATIDEPLPAEYLNQTGYEFYEIDPATKRPVEYGQDLGRNKDQRYWNTLYDLAWEIKEVLTKAKKRNNAPTAGRIDVFSKVAPPPKGTVYLAETTYDRREDRNNIKRELQDRGYEILPDRELPLVSPDYENAVREHLRRSRLSIHLIGDSYGTIPERANNRSIVELQNELAAERSVATGFPRLIWLPEGLLPKEDRQATFIEELKTRLDQQKGAELLQTSLEELKFVLKGKVDALSANGHQKTPPRAGITARRKIYLLFDKRDVAEIMPINKYLAGRKNCEVILPPIDDDNDDDTQAIKLHEDNLLRCDAVLIFYGKANPRVLPI